MRKYQTEFSTSNISRFEIINMLQNSFNASKIEGIQNIRGGKKQNERLDDS